MFKIYRKEIMWGGRKLTLELDDAQRVLHRMWWLGQQITLELDPRRVLDRFLSEA